MKPPDHEALAGRLLDAQLHLLDRQVIDVHGAPVTVVDDLELSDVVLDEDLPPDTAGAGDRGAAQRTGARHPALRRSSTGIALDQDALVGDLRDRGGRQAGRGRRVPGCDLDRTLGPGQDHRTHPRRPPSPG